MSATETATKTASQSFPAASILGLLFVTAKIFHQIDWPWWIVLAPFWAPVAVLLVIMAVLLFVIGIVATVGALCEQHEKTQARKQSAGKVGPWGTRP